jgi:multidrug efflux pump subunit AcrA (membrane-fusion protein)
MTEETAQRRPLAATLMLILCALILGGGVLGMIGLLALRKPPAQAEISEKALRVEVAALQPQDVPVLMTGYGEVKAIDQVAVVPEVAGQIVEVHPRLKAGEVIPAGEVLFRINPADYEAAVKRAEGTVAQLQNGLEGLRKQQVMDGDMLATLRGTLDLSNKEYDRLRELYSASEVGTQAGVERSEMARNQAKASHDQLAHAIDLYPQRIGELEGGLAAAKAALELAKNQLARTSVSLTFNARVKSETIEVGQVVAPGAMVAMLANDSALEIRVPLDSRDARQWLQFDDADTTAENAWFSRPNPVACDIRWSEDPDSHVWQGQLVRVEAFDPETRTLTVVVRIDGNQFHSQDAERLPLVDGMFCSVDIPGRTLQGVYSVPRWAVSYDGDIYIAKESRLEIRRVEVMRQQGDTAIFADGVQPGESVITTRLVNPSPNSLIEITTADKAEDAQAEKPSPEVAAS